MHQTFLCPAIALMTRTLCSKKMDDLVNIQPLMACWLIPLDKFPGGSRKSPKIELVTIDRRVDLSGKSNINEVYNRCH